MSIYADIDMSDTERGRNGLAGYDSRQYVAGKFPPKRHIYVCRHKRVRRDSGGWGCVRMGAGDAFAPSKRKTRQTETQIGPQDII